MVKPEDFDNLGLEYSNQELSGIEQRLDNEIKCAIACGRDIAMLDVSCYSDLTLQRIEKELMPKYDAAGWKGSYVDYRWKVLSSGKKLLPAGCGFAVVVIPQNAVIK